MADGINVFVCYIPGLDRRRIDSEHTPFIQSLLNQYPTSTLETIPSTELTPTLLTGVGPDKNGIWQVSLKDETTLSPLGKLVDLLPDVVTTTAQCFGHLMNSKRDLAAVPWRRRRQFNLHRMKYTRRNPTRPVWMRSVAIHRSSKRSAMNRPVMYSASTSAIWKRA